MTRAPKPVDEAELERLLDETWHKWIRADNTVCHLEMVPAIIARYGVPPTTAKPTDAPETEPTLHYARVEGYDMDAMRAAARLTPLHQRGDCHLVWVSTGDLTALQMLGRAKDMTAPEPPPVHLHGFTITAAPERRLVGIEVHEQGAFSPEAAEALADALRAAAQRARGQG